MARGKKWIGVAVGVAVLTGVGLFMADGLISESSDPTEVVAQYLDAIARGDEQEANRLSAPPEDLQEGLLVNASAYIKVGSITTVESGEESATVSAEFSLDGKDFEKDFSLIREEGDFLSPDKWTLDSTLIGTNIITVAPTTSNINYKPKLTVAGSVLDTDSFWYTWVSGYPAVYETTISSSDYFDGDEILMPLWPRGTESDIETSRPLGITPSDALVAEILQQGDALAQACVNDRTLFVNDADDRGTFCPWQTDRQRAEACTEAPGSRMVQIGDWSVSCIPDSQPFGSSVRSERAGNEMKIHETGRVLHMGPYTFVDEASGAETVQYLNYVTLTWQNNKPVISGGDFAEERLDDN